jgi:LytS/YehU family sensor histidine kinase
LIAATHHRLPSAGSMRILGLAGTVVACCFGGLVLRVGLHRWQSGGEGIPLREAAYFACWLLILSTLLVLMHHFSERSRVALEALHAVQLRGIALQRDAASAQLQLLQAQVEPHFIFNALANVRRLLRTEPSGARTMLADLLRYLQAALPALREEHTTLGREADLVRAFIAVHQVRMGPRLVARVNIAPELAAHAVPPMVLLTLVENALKHGLQPLVEGGSLLVDARVDKASVPAQLQLRVSDTGRGMGSGSGGGTGLANLRARLKSMYGAAALLRLEMNEPRGVIAVVSLPLEPAP